MKYLLFLVIPIFSTFLLLIVQKLGENYWQKQHSDSSASDYTSSIINTVNTVTQKTFGYI